MTEPPVDPTAEELARIEQQLSERRPAPAPAFRGRLAQAVAHEARRRRITARPQRLWARVALLVAAGTALLTVAVVQL